MQLRTLSLAVAGLVLAAGSFAANAAVLFQNLGSNAPPATLGSHTMAPFDLAPQVAIPEYTFVSSIPGAPGGATLGVSPAGEKYTVGSSWGSSWAGGYLGPIYFMGYETDTTTLTLPAGTKAFYFYTTPNRIGTPFIFTATTDGGTTSGPVSVTTTSTGSGGSNGFAFYSTAGESISSITVFADTPSGYAIGEFGIATGAATTCASQGYTATKLLWCQNICEKGYTGATLQTWLHRWIRQFRDLPYCAMEPANATS